MIGLPLPSAQPWLHKHMPRAFPSSQPVATLSATYPEFAGYSGIGGVMCYKSAVDILISC